MIHVWIYQWPNTVYIDWPDDVLEGGAEIRDTLQGKADMQNVIFFHHSNFRQPKFTPKKCVILAKQNLQQSRKSNEKTINRLQIIQIQ